MSAPFSHLVFVDFENVPAVDLALVDGKPVHVTLLIGEKQKRLELALVRQIHQHAAQVSLIEVGASGRNALDLVLAAHLGRAMAEHPEAEFTIISRDHDFDPLVAHFSVNRRRVSREPDFSALPVFGGVKAAAPVAHRRHAAPKPAASPRKAAAHAALSPAPNNREKKMDRLIAHLRAKTNRPKTRDSLLHHINTVFGQKLSAEEQEEILNELLPSGIFTIPDGRKVVYSS
jgi:hypothetical protein